MRIYVPRALHAITYSNCRDSYWEGDYHSSPPTRQRIQCAVCLPADTIQVEDGSYFWDTHHRPMNDCIHSKLSNAEDVEIIPNGVLTVNGKEYIYSRNLYVYGSFAYLHDRDNYSICNMIDAAYRNENFISYGVSISPQWYTGYVRFYFTIRFSYCTVEQKTYPTIPYFNARVLLTMNTFEENVFLNWYEAHPTSKRSSNIDSFSGGNSEVRKHFWALWSEVEPGVCQVLAGLTKYYTYSTTSGRSWYYFAHSCRNMFRDVCNYILDSLSIYPAYGRKTKWKNWISYTYKGTDLQIPELVLPKDRFLFHEDDRIQQGIDPYCLDNSGLQNYWWNVLVQQAYLDTLNSVPKLNDNSISNIIEIAGFIKSLVIDHKVDLPKSLGDVWLSYRYQYTTTRLDAEEAISFMHRHRELGTLEQWIHCFGVSHVDFSNTRFQTRVTCRCGLEIRPTDVAMLGKIWRALYTYGLQPNFYVVWDMIPYSFIIDWLIPVGNMMHALDAGSMYDGTYYEIKDVVFSMSYDIVDEYANEYHQYTRWVQNDIPQLNGFYFFEEDPVSTKVKGMRILDTLSLFIGRRK